MTRGANLFLNVNPSSGPDNRHNTTTAHASTVAKMVLAKSKKSVGLGNSLMNDRFGKGKGADMRRGTFQQGIERTGQNGERVCAVREI
jgi:hypothetical protein